MDSIPSPQTILTISSSAAVMRNLFGFVERDSPESQAMGMVGLKFQTLTSVKLKHKEVSGGSDWNLKPSGHLDRNLSPSEYLDCNCFS